MTKYTLPQNAASFVKPIEPLKRPAYKSDDFGFTSKFSRMLDDYSHPVTVLIAEEGADPMTEIQQLIMLEHVIAADYRKEGSDMEAECRVIGVSMLPPALLGRGFSFDAIARDINQANQYKLSSGTEVGVNAYIVLKHLGATMNTDMFGHALGALYSYSQEEMESFKDQAGNRNRLIIPMTLKEWNAAQVTMPKLAHAVNVLHLPAADEAKVEELVDRAFDGTPGYSAEIRSYLIDSSNRYVKGLVQPGAAIRLGQLALVMESEDSDDEELGRDKIDAAVKHMTNVDASAFALPLKEFSKQLTGKIVGQKAGLERIARGIKRGTLNGYSSRPKPVYSCLLYGESGIGKTLLAETLAKLFTGDKRFLRIDASELKSAELANARLLGMPIGYKGFEQGGVLTEFARRHKGGVVLVDEFEKAGDGVEDLFMRALDTGSVTSAVGEVFDLTNFVFIFTTNAGVKKESRVGFLAQEAEVDPRVALAGAFKTEVLNRFDDVIQFEALKKSDLAKIAANTLSDMLETSRKRGDKAKMSKKRIQTLSAEVAEVATNGRQAYRIARDSFLDGLVE